MSGIAFRDLLGIAPAFGRRYGNVPVGFLLYPNWSLAAARKVASIASAARAHAQTYPEHRLVFLCSTAEERDLLRGTGLDAVAISSNLLVSERTFQPLDTATVAFDAVYNARFDPAKRHELAARVPRCAYVTYDDPAGTEHTRQQQRERLIHALAAQPGHVLVNDLQDGLPVRLAPEDVNLALNRAAVGLCLSRVEGSNYATTEYLLAGLPVVSTPSTGGREVWLDPEHSIVCDADPQDVADAVRRLAARDIPREEVRARTLERVELARRSFLEVLETLRKDLGGATLASDGWPPEGLRYLPAWDQLDAHLDRLDERRLP
jgi:glycosyltransferase involved in cell wall biosynthesis